MRIKKNDFYKLTVRPTVVITTVSKNGISNAAPFSFNSPLSAKSPLFGFSCKVEHDTWRNIKENKEFVVNFVGENFGPLMHILEEDFPYEVSEIEKAHLTAVKSKRVKPPRIEEAFAWLECEMVDHLDLSGIDIDQHVWIVGKILEAEVKEGCIKEVVDVEKVKPLNHVYREFFVTEMQIKKFKRLPKATAHPRQGSDEDNWQPLK